MGSFFGVTALGPESIFESSKISTLGVTLFTDDEFTRSFNLLASSPTLPSSQLIPLLRLTFGFEPLPEEVILFQSSINGDFSLPELLHAVQVIRGNLRKLNPPQFQSWQEMNDNRRKSVRCQRSPSEVFKAPMTTQQEIGWDTRGVFQISRFPKRTCDVTRFQDSFLKSGWKA